MKSKVEVMEKKNKLSSIGMIILVTLLYIIAGYVYDTCCIRNGVGSLDMKTLFILLGLFILVIFGNVLYPIIYTIKNRNTNINELDMKKNLNKVLILKLVLIPFFIWNLILFTLLTVGTLIIPFTPVFVLVGFVGVSFTYTILLATSAYAICMILLLYKNHKISLKSTTLNIIMQFIFVLDVISYIVFYIKNRKQVD